MIEANTKPLIQSKSVVAGLNETGDTMIVTATESYIPMQEFKEFFGKVGDYVKSNDVNKLIFDKSNLRTFHQPSMVWYHVEWKSVMAKYGLSTYRKILPDDKLFTKSVEVGRNKIKEEHPDFNFTDYDIQYVASVEEGLQK